MGIFLTKIKNINILLIKNGRQFLVITKYLLAETFPVLCKT
jgi:hypothetical protein